METYFVRHTLRIDIDDETRRRLWKEHRIAIHFPWASSGNKARDSFSVDPDGYKGPAKRALRALVALSRNGGYVCAEHHGYADCMLGFVAPGSKIELLRGKWGDNHNRQGRTAILKTLRLAKVRFVPPLDYAVLGVGRPRQGTIMRWHLARATVQNLVEGRHLKPQLSDLSPRQQEILCSEFLRLRDAESRGLPRLAHLLLPPGRTMRDVDIVGTAVDGKALLAQVTFAELAAAKWKLDRLRCYRNAKRAHLVLFCDCQDKAVDDGVTIFPIQHVYRLFTGTASGKRWLNRSA